MAPLLLLAVSLTLLQPVQAGREARGIRTYVDVKELDPSELEAAVTKLSDLGIVTDSQYWIDNAQVGKVIPSSSMTEVLILAANKFEPASTIEEALAVLQKQKILTDMERWKHQLIDKSNFPGADAFFLLYVLAEKIK